MAWKLVIQYSIMNLGNLAHEHLHLKDHFKTLKSSLIFVFVLETIVCCFSTFFACEDIVYLYLLQITRHVCNFIV